MSKLKIRRLYLAGAVGISGLTLALAGCSTGTSTARPPAEDDDADAATLWQVDDNFSIDYEHDSETMHITFELTNGNKGWMGMSFHEFMFPADSIIAWWDPDSQSGQCLDLYNPGIPTLPSFPAPIQDTNPEIKVDGGSPFDNKDNTSVESASNSGGKITITCSRPMDTQDIMDFQFFENRSFPVVAAYNAEEIWSDEYNVVQPNHTQYGASEWHLSNN